MRRSISASLIFLAAVMLISVVQSVPACSCFAIEPDTAYQNAIVVFSGTVERVNEITREIVYDGKTRVTSDGRIAIVKVEQYFKGSGGPTIELRSRNSSCDINFEAGKHYLIYSTRDAESGELAAYTCSRTKLMDDNYSKPDTSYLRHIARGEQPTMLYGFVFKNTEESARRGGPNPVGAVTVTIEGEGKRLEMKTDSKGYFELFGLPTGSYRIYTSLTGKVRGGDAQTVELKGVASVAFRTTMLGSLKGRLLDQENQPVADLMVEIVHPGLPGLHARESIATYVTSLEDGTFVFDEVLAGRYMLAVNSTGRRSLYGAPFLPSYFPKAGSPAEAQVIVITDSASTDVGDFVLQDRYPTVPVSGIAVDTDGKPVGRAYINLHQNGAGWDATRPVQTDAEGLFVVQAFEGISYTIDAFGESRAGGTIQSDRIEVFATRDAKPVRIVLKAPGK